MLVYLARQINQNTLTVRSSALSAYTQLSMELNHLLGTDPELNNLFWTVLSDRESLPTKISAMPTPPSLRI